MEFFATNGKRPVRSCEKTRLFAYESLNHKYGLLSNKTMWVEMDDYEGFETLTEIEQYDACIRRAVEQAPLRICDGEYISGSASYGITKGHKIPAVYKGELVFHSVSHLTIDFETVVKKGVNAIKEDAIRAYEKHKNTDREPFAKSCLSCIESMEIWHRRYLDILKDMPDYKDNYENLKKVPFQPAESFYEAVQSIWFTFAFVRLCGNWPGIGRLDWLLGDFLEKDLASGKITLEQAREILAHFFIKGCEWVWGGSDGTGDAQHYQNILLAGIDEDGKEITNTVTYLVLDILEEFGISDFPTTVRVNKNTDEKLLKRVAQVISYGGGTVAVYNEDLIIDSLTQYGYDLTEARKFANDGCWEVQIPGKTYFAYFPFDALCILQKQTLKDYDENLSFNTFDELLEKFIKDLNAKVDSIGDEYGSKFTKNEKNEWVWAKELPCTVVSIFEQGCIEKGLSYMEGGPIYNVVSPHIGGLPDVVNDLYAIKKLVFDEKKVTFTQLMNILKSNWENDELLRRYVLTKYSFFGNDNDEVDMIAKRLVDEFAYACDRQNGMCGFKMPAGISTFGRQLEWSPYRMATASGRKAHDVLAGNFSPTPGTDKDGATAIIKSYCKSDMKKMVSGAALDIKLLPMTVNAEYGIDALASLIKGFVSLGGHFMQIDIADTELLKKAQEHPEEYQNLSVRISGWNARFTTLNKEWQDMIIAQTGCNF